ncbi:MAG: PP0621 family protein [Candidatus Thiodiazotropha sp.]
MGLRYLFLGLAVWGVYLIIRHLIRQQKPQPPVVRRSKAVDSVQCAHCGLHLPREEALQKGDAYYCSQAHLQASDHHHDS